MTNIDKASAAVTDAEKTTGKMETATRSVEEDGVSDEVDAAAAVVKVTLYASADNESTNWPGQTQPTAKLAGCN